MKRFLVVAAVAAATLALAPVAAFAAAPVFPSHLVVPNKSVGGLALKAPISAARRIFGAKDCNPGGCTYNAGGGAAINVMFVQLHKHSTPFVGEISFDSIGKPNPLLDGFRTSAGIGIGSTVNAVRRAYPKATGAAKTGVFTIPGPGQYYTNFGLENGKVASVSMAAVHLG